MHRKVGKISNSCVVEKWNKFNRTSENIDGNNYMFTPTKI